MRANLFPPLLVALPFFTPAAFSQVTVISTESFDYSFPAVLDLQNGGFGWADAWSVLPFNNGVVLQANPPTNPNNPYPWPEADGIGYYAQQALEFNGAIRTPDQTGHDDVVENGLFGKDGSTIWLSFTAWGFLQGGIHFGSISFMEQGVEKWLAGSPWATFAWGIDECPGTGCISFIPGTDDAISARLVVRIDYMPGQDRVRMWVDPAEAHPLTNPGLDVMIEDLRWDQLQLWSGGSISLFYWDNIVLEKGVPVPPAPYCFGDGTGTPCPCGNSGNAGEGCANGTGSGGLLVSTGSTSEMADDLGFDASNLLPSQPALLFVGNNAINNGNGILFGDGLRCAGGSVIRLGIETPDAAGNASWGPGLGATAGWMAGDTKRFQVWYRDPLSSPCGFLFNLSNGMEIFFTL